MTKKTYCYDHPRPAVTVDLVLFRGGKKNLEVLLIKRGRSPFKGQWAFPGGFVDENEPLEKAAVRELEEETEIRRVDLQQFGTFGDPGRDPRGHTISVGFLAHVRKDVQALASGDAAEAEWFGVKKVPPLAFDHDQLLRVALAAISPK